MQKLTCWSDESRGMQTCERNDIAAVNIDGYAALGCRKCMTVLGEPVAPATRTCEPFVNGWRKIPREYLG